MKSIKSTLAALIVLGFSVNAFAMSDDNYLGGINAPTGDILSSISQSISGVFLSPVSDDR